jgi:multiple antibiotic resistance protein
VLERGDSAAKFLSLRVPWVILSGKHIDPPLPISDSGETRMVVPKSLQNRHGTRFAVLIVFLFWTAVAPAQTAMSGSAGASIPPPTAISTISLGKVFTYFMVMLGPIKLVGPFVRATKGMDAAECRRLAAGGFSIACLAGLAAAFVGRSTLEKWNVSLPALLLTAGLVLLLVALQAVLLQYSSPPDLPAENEAFRASAPKNLASSPIAFPHIITPYGTAALILLVSAADDRSRVLQILGIFLVVMFLNLAAMLFARPILKYGTGVLSFLGAVLGILQVALAVQMLIIGGRMLRVVPP